MYPIVATAYDQNPARIASIVRKNRKGSRANRTVMFSALVTVAAAVAFAFNHFFTRA